MRAKFLFAAFFLCLFSVPAHADDKSDAGAFADNLGHQALSILSDKSLSIADKRPKLEALFQQNVAIDWVGQFVLGRFWRDASDAQKQQYLANYKSFLIKHYTSNLASFTDANFQVSKIAPQDQGGFDVTMRIKKPGSEDTIVDYTVRKNEAGNFQVYDIIVEGVSMITTQRSEFNSVVSQKGLDYLIEQLKMRSQADAQNTDAGTK